MSSHVNSNEYLENENLTIEKIQKWSCFENPEKISLTNKDTKNKHSLFFEAKLCEDCLDPDSKQAIE